MTEALRAVKGMNDILPPDSARWEWFEATVRETMRRHGYLDVRTPLVEPTALFARGLGEVTDIVEKEMYSFEDALNGDRLTLRPEATAGVVRAMNEHSFLREGGRRLFYIGPMFRHERPQKGRYRQFHQVGAEALGFPGPDVDAEVVLLVRAIWQALGLESGTHVTLEVNSLGDAGERAAHRAALITHFEAHASALDAEATRRLHGNPLRLLDSKHPPMQAAIEAAPRLTDFLGESSLRHFEAFRAMLDGAGLPHRVNHRLVRGMDYYNRTVFEWVTDRLGSQATVCGGGRYDPLIARLGGKDAPACGWGMGIERVLLLLEDAERRPPARPPEIYVVVLGAAQSTVAVAVADRLRTLGFAVLLHPLGTDGTASAKAQFRKADASGARYAVVVGEAEAAMRQLGLKDLRDAGTPQTNLSLDDLESEAERRLGHCRNP
jgi:histidyl-tRNA synthetase